MVRNRGWLLVRVCGVTRHDHWHGTRAPNCRFPDIDQCLIPDRRNIRVPACTHQVAIEQALSPSTSSGIGKKSIATTPGQIFLCGANRRPASLDFHGSASLFAKWIRQSHATSPLHRSEKSPPHFDQLRHHAAPASRLPPQPTDTVLHVGQ